MKRFDIYPESVNKKNDQLIYSKWINYLNWFL